LAFPNDPSKNKGDVHTITKFTRTVTEALTRF